MPWQEPWPLKLRRRATKLYMRLSRRRGYFVTRYLGASFLVPPRGIGTLELAAKTWERPELQHLMERCASLKPALFIDVGANIGVYTCVLLKNGSAPRALLFEPDRENLVSLRANLLINGLTGQAEVHELALGEENAQFALFPGATAKEDYRDADGGSSMVVESDAAAEFSYPVEVAPFDDRFAISGQTLAIKMDVEHYECRALSGMKRTLRENRCVVQVETYIMREQVIGLMSGLGYKIAREFFPNIVFEN